VVENGSLQFVMYDQAMMANYAQAMRAGNGVPVGYGMDNYDDYDDGDDFDSDGRDRTYSV